MTKIALTISAVLLSSCAAFMPSSPRAFTRQTEQNMMVFPDSIYTTSTTLATIDMDIAKLSDNEFAPVFMGAIVVMFGGVLSALIVGFILDKGDLYASVVADSYIQSSDDEEFWKGLSEEEKKKAQALIVKVKASNDGTSQRSDVEKVAATVPKTSDLTDLNASVSSPGTGEPKKEMNMFNDYE
jgi:hypothetical protein